MTYSIRTAAATSRRPKRPLGISLIAGLGMLSGILYGLVTLIVFVLQFTAGQTDSSMFINLVVGLVVAWITLYIYWSLWDMLKWGWWLNLILHLLSIFGGLFVYLVLPATAVVLLQSMPPQMVDQTLPLLRGVVIGTIAFCVVVTVYLLAVHRAFGVGVRDTRPPWER